MNTLTENHPEHSQINLSALLLATLGLFVVGYALTRWLLLNPMTDETIWYLIRSSGVVAYLFLAGSTIWGLALSSKIVRGWVPAPLALAMHNYLSWNALCLTILHAILLLFSHHLDYTLANLLIPFTGPYSPFWVGLGIIGFYLMVLTTLTFYVRKQIGYKLFHVVHYFTYPAFVLAMLHSWVAGTDQIALGAVYLISSLIVFFLTAYRLLAVFNRGHQETAVNERLTSSNSQFG